MRVGAVISDRFEIQAFAGEGAMAAVYAALDRTTGQRVAVKLLHDLSTQQMARFAREAELLAGLEHRFIVRYLTHGEDEGRPYLVTEWLEGEELADRLRRGRLGVREALLLGRCLAEALGEAHRQGIVHRDVKPSNVFLVDGSLEEPRLLDFGVARGGGRSDLTASGAVIGTVGYLSPEQARGQADVDARADVFGLGATLFKCLTGTRPHETGDAMDMLVGLARGDAVSVRALRPEVPVPLDELLTRLLHADRDARPADGDAVAAALLAIGPACEAELSRSKRAPSTAPARSEPVLSAPAVWPSQPPEAGPSGTARGGQAVAPAARPAISSSRRLAIAAAVAAAMAVAAAAAAAAVRFSSRREAPAASAGASGALAPATSAAALPETAETEEAAEAAAGAPAVEVRSGDATAGAKDLPPPPHGEPSRRLPSAGPSVAAPSTATPTLAAGAFDEARARGELGAAVTEMRARCSTPAARGEVYLFWVRYDPASGVGTVGSSPSVQTQQNTARTAMACAQAIASARTFRVDPYAGNVREVSAQLQLR